MSAARPSSDVHEERLLRKIASLFPHQKQRILVALGTPDEHDRSRKGGVDEPVRELIEFLNTRAHYVTTSSCSGRISVFGSSPLCKPQEEGSAAEPSEGTAAEHGSEAAEVRGVGERVAGIAGGSDERVAKAFAKSGEWMFVSHDAVEPRDVLRCLSALWGDAPPFGHVVLKFEPCILHVQARTLWHARALLRCATAAGFRNSGMVIGKKQLNVAIRSTMHLDVPLVIDGVTAVSEEYVRTLLALCNAKLLENELRIQKLEHILQQDEAVNEQCEG